MKLKIVLYVIIMHLLFTIPVTGQQTAGVDNEPRNFQYYDSVLEKLFFTNVDSCLFYALKAVDFSRLKNNTVKETEYLSRAGECYRTIGEFPASLEMQFRALDNTIRAGDKFGEAFTYSFIGFTYTDFKEGRTAIPYFQRAELIMDSLLDASASKPSDTSISPFLHLMVCFTISNKGDAYESLDQLDSALYYQQKARTEFSNVYNGPLKSLVLTRIGNIYNKQRKYDEALQYYFASLQNALLVGE